MDIKITIAVVCAIILVFNLLGHQQRMEEFEALMVIGGKNEYGSLDTSELLQMKLYSVAADYFCGIPKFPKKIHAATGALLSNDKPIVCGGSTKDVLATKECYVLKNCQNGCYERVTGHGFKLRSVGFWSLIKMTQARTHASSVPINSTHLWVTGGRGPPGASGTGKLKRTTELINVMDSTSNLYYELENGIEDHAMVHIDGIDITVLIGGKIDRHGTASNKTYLFDHKSGSFESGPPLLQSRWGHTAGVIYTDKGTSRAKSGIVVVGGCIDSQNCLDSVEILWDINSPNAQWISGPTFLSKELLDMEDAMNKAAKYIENVTGKSYPNQYPSLNRGPGIGHKLTHSNDGNLVIVGGYDNHADTWNNVVRRLDCTTFKKTNLYPDCYWMDIQDGIVLTTGRKDHVAMMLHHKFCNIGNMLQAIFTIERLEQVGAIWHYFATIIIALNCLYKNWIYRHTIHRNVYNMWMVLWALFILNLLYFWIDLPKIFEQEDIIWHENLIIKVISRCLGGQDEYEWQIINVVSYIFYVATSVIQKDWNSLILIFCVLLPIQRLIILLSKFYYNPSTHQQVMKSFSDYLPYGGIELTYKYQPTTLETKDSNFYKTITESCILLVLSEMISPWIKYNITRILVAMNNKILSWVTEAPFFLIAWFQQIINQVYMMICENVSRLKNFIKLNHYKKRQKWIRKTPCKITRKINFVYELNYDSESIHTVTSPDFLRQMVNYFIEDFQKNYLIVFSGERRTKAIKAISKACEIKIYGKPKDMQKRFEMTGMYGGTLDTGSNVEITLPNLYPRYPFKITIQNSIKYDNFCEIIRFWRIIARDRRANELNHFDGNNAEENVNPIELENEGNNNEFHNYPKTVPYLNNFVKHFKAQRYLEASKFCVDAFAVAKSDEENIVLKYCHSMALLCSKDLANAEAGYNNLKELHELELVKWKTEFPAIYCGLAKFEIALRAADCEFLNEKFNEVLNPIKVPCHDVLKEIFPEMEFDVVLQNGLMQTLRNSINMDIVATCRYKNCRNIFEKSERGIVKWKSTIKLDDIDYKGFTQLKCTDKCIVDFHPWCWKDKKEDDFKREKHDGLLHKTLLDKDYLKLNCPTPDCNAPVFKVSLFKDDLNCPLELTDDELTRKILAGGKPKNSHKPSAEFEPKIENDIELENSKYKNSMKVLEEKKEKDLHRQIRGLQKKIHKDKLEMAKCEIANKHIMKENADLAASHYLNMEEFKYQHQQLQNKNDDLLRNHEEEPNDQDTELCYLFLQKSIEFENFAENINNILLRKGILCLELSRIESEATNCIKKTKEILQQSPEDRIPGQIKALIQMNLEVDYEKLKEFCISNLNTYLFEEEESEETSEPN